MGYMSPACVPNVMDCWQWGLPAGAVIIAKPKVPAALTAYDKLIKEELKALSIAGKKLGGAVEGQCGTVVEAFEAQRVMLEKALRIKQPTMDNIGLLAKETFEAMHRVEAACDAAAEPPATFKAHTRMIAGAVSAMGWVTSDQPGDYIKDTLNAIPVYGRQVREVEGDEHAALVVALSALLKRLRDLCSEHFGRGLLLAGEAATDSEKYSFPAKEMLQEYRLLMSGKLQPLLRAMRCLPAPPSDVPLLTNPMQRLAVCCEELFKAQAQMLEEFVTKHRQPPEDKLGHVLEPTTEVLNQLEEVEEEAAGPYLQHVQMVASGLGAIAWVSVASPTLYVTEILNSVPALGEKVGVHGEEHQKFVLLFKELLRGLLAYVKAFHPNGVHWNPAGKPL
jgi:hypothetical protein